MKDKEEKTRFPAMIGEMEKLRTAFNNVKAVLGLIGNIDHSIGNGPNAAKLRGQMLNDIRNILKGK